MSPPGHKPDYTHLLHASVNIRKTLSLSLLLRLRDMYTRLISSFSERLIYFVAQLDKSLEHQVHDYEALIRIYFIVLDQTCYLLSRITTTFRSIFIHSVA